MSKLQFSLVIDQMGPGQWDKMFFSSNCLNCSFCIFIDQMVCATVGCEVLVQLLHINERYFTLPDTTFATIPRLEFRSRFCCCEHDRRMVLMFKTPLLNEISKGHSLDMHLLMSHLCKCSTLAFVWCMNITVISLFANSCSSRKDFWEVCMCASTMKRLKIDGHFHPYLRHRVSTLPSWDACILSTVFL